MVSPTTFPAEEPDVAGPRWLDEEQQAAWRSVIALTMRLPYELDVQLQRDADLTHFEFLVLVMLSEAPDRTLRMGRLAELANASLSRTSHVVGRLERRGYVERSKAADDRRGNLAGLTTRGHAALTDAAAGHVEAVQTLVVEALTRDQLRDLGVAAAAVLARIEAAPQAATVD